MRSAAGQSLRSWPASRARLIWSRTLVPWRFGEDAATTSGNGTASIVSKPGNAFSSGSIHALCGKKSRRVGNWHDEPVGLQKHIIHRGRDFVYRWHPLASPQVRTRGLSSWLMSVSTTALFLRGDRASLPAYPIFSGKPAKHPWPPNRIDLHRHAFTLALEPELTGQGSSTGPVRVDRSGRGVQRSRTPRFRSSLRTVR